jgi:hypothetical protein
VNMKIGKCETVSHRHCMTLLMTLTMEAKRHQNILALH